MNCTAYRKRGPTWAFECRDDSVLDMMPDHTCADPRRVWFAVGKLRGGVCGAAEGVCR